MYTYTHSLCTHVSNKGGRLIIKSREIGKGFKSEGGFHLQKYFEGVNVSLTATYKKHSFTHLFTLRVTYNDPANQRILNRLLKEVKALNPEFLTQHVKGNVLADMYMQYWGLVYLHSLGAQKLLRFYMLRSVHHFDNFLHVCG